jgi:hypothetical protein
VFSSALDVRPNPIAAAISRASNMLAPPAVVAVTTLAQGADTTSAGGRVWLLDQNGDAVAGWPAHLPSIVTTPPVIVGAFADTCVYVGCADGRVYAIRLDGTIAATSPSLGAPITGRLAAYPEPLSGSPPGDPFILLAAGSANGNVGAFAHLLPPLGPQSIVAYNANWPVNVGHAGFAPDFVWIDFGGARNASSPTLSTSPDCTNGALTLVVHDADALRAYCLGGSPLSGWGTSLGDTIVAGLAAGDVDGDGFPEVIAQTRGSAVYFFTITGRPSPGGRSVARSSASAPTHRRSRSTSSRAG